MSRSSRIIARTTGVVLISLATLGPARGFDMTKKEGTFEAFWTVSGTVHILEFMDGGTVASGRLTGNVVLETSQGPIPSFDTDCVGFADDRTGSTGRCVWIGTSGDEIYVELKGSGMGGFGPTRGTFIGGTGRYEGITGGFQYEWSYSVGRGEDATLDGYTLRMAGRYSLEER